jgi:hypothetical protein
MSITTLYNGRLGNQIIRNIAVSLIAEKHNLFVNYANYNLICDLGIRLFIGENRYNNTIDLTDENYFCILEQNILNNNIDPNNSFFQTKDITKYLHKYLNYEENKQFIINKNTFKENYNTNNDLFIHIRLTDASCWNPGLEYYLKGILHINFDKLYITSDDLSHIIIKEITNKYPSTILLTYDEINTIQFGSTCKHIILSHGSFSAIIGYLAFFSNIYYPTYEKDKIWYGDMFSIDGWNKI